MNQNAILVAAILFISGCAHQQGGYGQAESGRGSSYQPSDPSTTSTEIVQRDASGRMITPADPPTALEHDPAMHDDFDSDTMLDDMDADSDEEFQVNDSYRDTDNAAEYSNQGRIRADSSIRGGSNEARGIDRSGNQLEPAPEPLNPQFEADSSIRGGSNEARQRQFNDFGLEPPHDWNTERSPAADSSIRGGSNEARGYRSPAFRGSVESDLPDLDSSTYQGEISVVEPMDIEGGLEGDTAQGGFRGTVQGVGSSEIEQGIENRDDSSSSINDSDSSESAMSDDELSRQVKATLTRESTGTHGLLRHEVARNVTVSANNGEITLRGSVPSQQDKDLLAIRAREIKCVKRVHNELTVSPQSDPANREVDSGHDLEDKTDQLLD